MARFKVETAPTSLGESRVATELSGLATTIPEPVLRYRLSRAVEIIKNIPGKWPVGPLAQFEIIQKIFGDEAPLRSSLDTVNGKGLFVHEKITVGNSRLVVGYGPREMLVVIAFFHTRISIEESVGHAVPYQAVALETIRRLGFDHPLINGFEKKALNAELIETYRRETDFAAITKELEEIPDQAEAIREFLLQKTRDFLQEFSYFPVDAQDIASLTVRVFNRPDDTRLAARLKTDFIKRLDMPTGTHLYDGRIKGLQAFYPRDLLALWAFLYEAGFLSSESGENRLTPVEGMNALNRVVLKLGTNPIALRLGRKV